jgi:hypothetical protein
MTLTQAAAEAKRMNDLYGCNFTAEEILRDFNQERAYNLYAEGRLDEKGLNEAGLIDLSRFCK